LTVCAFFPELGSLPSDMGGKDVREC